MNKSKKPERVHCISTSSRRVIARQEIRAPTFQLRNELLWGCEVNFCIGFSQYPEEAEQTKRRAVFHDFGLRRISEFFRFPKCVFQFTEAIDQLVFECVLTRQNSH